MLLSVSRAKAVATQGGVAGRPGGHWVASKARSPGSCAGSPSRHRPITPTNLLRAGLGWKPPPFNLPIRSRATVVRRSMSVASAGVL